MVVVVVVWVKGRVAEGSYRRSRGYWGERMGVDDSARFVFFSSPLFPLPFTRFHYSPLSLLTARIKFYAPL